MSYLLKHSFHRQLKLIKMKQLFIWTILLLAGLTILKFAINYSDEEVEYENNKPILRETNMIYNDSLRLRSYDRNLPLIFVGGMPRSGTTLMRAMLDSHPRIHCGEETRIIPRLLFLRNEIWTGRMERERLTSARMSDAVIDSAMSAFILQIMVNHDNGARRRPRLCNKDPFVLQFSTYMKRLFPNSKFILMIRDGRATVHSIMTRKVSINGFNLSNYRECLFKWNKIVDRMYHECTQMGTETCLPVYYEQLVLHPEESMRKVLEFVGEAWSERVLEHAKFVERNEVRLSPNEFSSNQVIKPINLDALANWYGHIPSNLLPDIPRIAPMLAKLGYDPASDRPPNYGSADSLVRQNTIDIHRNRKYWDEKAKKYNQIKT